jgi:hypothetical protein
MMGPKAKPLVLIVVDHETNHSKPGVLSDKNQHDRHNYSLCLID